MTLSGNDLKIIPSTVLLCTNLRKLVVSNSQIQRLQNLSEFSQLNQLDLSRNDLDDGSFGLLPTSLVHLNLSHNHLRNFPTIISSLIELIELNLVSNRISQLTGVESLISLQCLLVDDNNLTEISSSIGNLQQLKKLSIKRNNFDKYSKTDQNQSSLPSTLFTNTQLEVLDIEGNPGLTVDIVLKFDGVDKFLERRSNSRQRNFSSGVLPNNNISGTLW